MTSLSSFSLNLLRHKEYPHSFFCPRLRVIFCFLFFFLSLVKLFDQDLFFSSGFCFFLTIGWGRLLIARHQQQKSSTPSFLLCPPEVNFSEAILIFYPLYYPFLLFRVSFPPSLAYFIPSFSPAVLLFGCVVFFLFSSRFNL